MKSSYHINRKIVDKLVKKYQQYKESIQEGTKVIDPEFAFYGPMGYDIGNVIGNLFFAWANKYYTE